MAELGEVSIGCGIRQFYDIYELRDDYDDDEYQYVKAAKVIRHLAESEGAIAFFRRGPGSQIIFSDMTSAYRAGTQLASVIEEQGWGEVYQGPKVVNPNSGNEVCIWIWVINAAIVKAVLEYR